MSNRMPNLMTSVVSKAERRLWFDRVRASFWIVPTVFLVAAVVAAWLVLWWDRATVDAAPPFWAYAGGPEGARTILATIAGSTITVVGLVFTITVVALQLASTQFGPRILRNLIQDRGIQVALGAFVASFVFSLIVLTEVRSGPDVVTFVPARGVQVAIVLSVASFMVLIGFLHHFATEIQVNDITHQIGASLRHAVRELYEAPEGTGVVTEGSLGDDDRRRLHGVEVDGWVVRARHSGYVQSIFSERVVAVAEQHDLVVKLEVRAGDFVIEGGELARVHGGEERHHGHIAHVVCESVIVGWMRTLAQDVEFAINQQVEIAIRALSPAVNDSFTGITCVDWLSDALASVGDRPPPPHLFRGPSGTLRLATRRVRIAGLVDAAFDLIRQNSRSNPAISVRLLEAIGRVAAVTHDPQTRRALAEQAQMIVRATKEDVREPADVADVVRRWETLRPLLDDVLHAKR